MDYKSTSTVYENPDQPQSYYPYEDSDRQAHDSSRSYLRKLANHTHENKLEKKERNRDRVTTIFVRLFLGGVFIYASFDKLLHPAAFSEAVYNYQILPDVFINLTAIILPWLELIMGIMLVIGVWMPGVVVMSNFLLTAFMWSLIFNMARGLDIYCGCFSASATQSSIDIWIVLRDASFLILSLYLLFVVFFTKPSAASKRASYNPS